MVDGLSIYVVVVLDDNNCPTEVQVSVVEVDKSMDQRKINSTRANVGTLEMLVNYSLSSGLLPVEPLIVLLLDPPSKYSKVIAHALIAAMEA